MATRRITFTLDDQVAAEAAFLEIYESKGPRRTDFLRRIISDCAEVQNQLGRPAKRKERNTAVKTAGIVVAFSLAVAGVAASAAEMRVNRGLRPIEMGTPGDNRAAPVEAVPLPAPAGGMNGQPSTPAAAASVGSPVRSSTPVVGGPIQIAPPAASVGQVVAPPTLGAAPAVPARPPATTPAEPAAGSVLRDETGQVYEAHPGEWLSDVLARWAQDSGWQKPEWRSPWGYRVQYSASYRGQFQDVVAQLLRPYAFSGNPPLEFRFAAVNRVLVVFTPSDDFGWSRY